MEKIYFKEELILKLLISQLILICNNHHSSLKEINKILIKCTFQV